MKYLCLAYGDETEWKSLSKSEQDALLAQDEALRKRGDLVAAVEPSSTVVRAANGNPQTTEGPFGASFLPLAGFGIIEAASLDESAWSRRRPAHARVVRSSCGRSSPATTRDGREPRPFVIGL
jgi:hypothetical protein